MAGGSLLVSAVKNGSFRCPLPVGHTVKALESILGHGVFTPGSCPAIPLASDPLALYQ